MSREGIFSWLNKHKSESAPTEATEMVDALKGASHEEWRVSRITKQNDDGTIEYNPRPKPINPTIDAAWIAENAELVTTRKDAKGNDEQVTDITKLSFDELPPSHKADTIASVTHAVESVLRAVKNGTPLEETFIDATADTIHEQWLVRNRKRVEKEISDLRAEDPEKNAAQIIERENQLLPYKQLGTDEATRKQQQGYDRVYVENAIAEYRRRHPEA